MLSNHYVFVGPQKTGTSWIDMVLRTSSDVALPENTKETFFFDRYFNKGLDFYKSLYNSVDASNISAEVAPSYAGNEIAIKRLSECIPNAKIVLTVREPVSRSISHYHHMVRYGYLKEGVPQAINQDPRIVYDSHYHVIIDSMFKHFKKEHIYVLSYEDLKYHPKDFVKYLSILTGARININDSTLFRKSNEKKVARNALISKSASLITDKFKEAGLYNIPRLARKIGLRNLIERSPKIGDPSTSDDDIEIIRKMMDFDYEEFKSFHASNFKIE